MAGCRRNHQPTRLLFVSLPLNCGHRQRHQRAPLIEFDETHPYFHQKRSQDDPFNHLRKVKYSAERDYRGSFLDLSDEDVLLLKSNDWKYEREWRMFRLLAEADVKGTWKNNIHLFAFPPDCIRKVIIGARTRQWIVRALLRRLGTSLDTIMYSCATQALMQESFA
jgi:hypothetical protein